MTVNSQLRAAIVICTFDADRWADLLRAVESARSQALEPWQIVVAVDHNEELLERVRDEIDGVIAVGCRSSRGASATRNAGAAASSGDLLAFLDDDAYAEPDWLSVLSRHLRDPSVVGAGGRTVAVWPTGRPTWFPAEFDWVVGGAYRGLAEQIAEVRNVWSSNMVVRREVFERIGGFRANFGKVESRPGPEDTELCIRAVDATPGGRWLYDPAAVVHHRVTEERITWRFYVRRCFDEGLGKAELAAISGVDRARESELEFIRYLLGAALRRESGEAFRQLDRSALARATAMTFGLSSAILGYGLGRARLKVNRGSQTQSGGHSP